MLSLFNAGPTPVAENAPRPVSASGTEEVIPLAEEQLEVGKRMVDRGVTRVRRLPRKPSLSRYLRDARIVRSLSVADLAERVGVSQASICLWENDRVRLREVNLSALCRVLKLPIRRAKEIAAG